MFKLTKIRNGRTNVPEIIAAYTDSDFDYIAGNIFYLCGNCVSTDPSQPTDFKFIPIESIPAGHPKTKIHGFIVNDDMEFDATAIGDHSDFRVGDGVTIHQDSNYRIIGVESSEGTDAIIVSIDNIEIDGTVTVSIMR